MLVVSTFEDRPPHDNGYLELTPPYFFNQNSTYLRNTILFCKQKGKFNNFVQYPQNKCFDHRQDQRCETVTQWSHL